MSTMTTKRPRESSPEASDTHKKPALEASDKPAPTTGCECGCVLQEGRCGIKLDEQGNKMCVCPGCNGGCNDFDRLCRDRSPESDASQSPLRIDACEDCKDMQNAECVSCRCCGMVHLRDGEIVAAEDFLMRDRSRSCTPEGSECSDA